MPTATHPSAPISLFYSYSQKDEAFRAELEKHLSLLKDQGVIEDWYDRRIEAGIDFDRVIKEKLDQARIILLLVSSDFMASRYIHDVEVTRAMEHHEAGTARVIPVILRSVDWRSAPFGKLIALPSNGKPVKSWEDLDEAFTDVALGIRKVASSLAGGTLEVDVRGSRRYSTGPDSGPFFVPFPRNRDFVGRSGDLESLHKVFQKQEPVGISPAGLTGMGGIGKTQLAVEYVYRYKNEYPDGIFWVNAAEPLVQGLASVGAKLRPATLDQSANQQLRVAFEELNRRPKALIVVDNLEDPAMLDRSVGLEASPTTLACRILFTTRQRELGRFHPVELTVLPEEPALQLLLRHPSRHAIRDSGHPEHGEARAICELLGRLPLALELAGAFLGKRSVVSLTAYRKRLELEGGLGVADSEAKRLPKTSFPPTHEPAVAATFAAQWEVLSEDHDEDAKQLLRVAGQFTEAAVLPGSTLGLFSGVSHAAAEGYVSDLAIALERLYDVRLIEELRHDHIRLHPLVREFADALTPKDEAPQFRHACACRVVEAFANVAAWEDFAGSNGIDGLEQCLTTAHDFATSADDGIRQTLASWLRIVQREANSLRDCSFKDQANAFAQQILFRAVTLGRAALARKAEERLSEFAQPALLLRWRTLTDSPALIRILAGHQGWVIFVAVSPDGRRIVSGSADKTVSVWDIQTGTLIHKLEGHQDPVNSLAVSPDGRHIISGSADKTVAVWDLQTGTRIHKLEGNQNAVLSVAVNPDGRRIVSGSSGKTVAVWDLESGTLIHELEGHQSWVHSLAVTPDGRRVVSGSADKTIAVWDLDSRTLSHKLEGHQHSVNSVAVSPDGRRIISGSADKTVMVWDLEAGTFIRKLEGHRDTVMSVAVAPDGRRIVSASGDKTVAVWDLQAGTLLHKLEGHQNAVNSVDVSPDGRRIVSGSADNTVAVWDLESGAVIQELEGHQSWVHSLAVSPDGRRVVSGSEDKTVAVWDLESGTLIRKLEGCQSAVYSVAVSPDGRRIVSGAYETVAVWDLQGGTFLHKLKGNRNVVRSVAFSPDGRRLVSGSDDTTVAVWDLQAGTLIYKLGGHQDPVTSVAVSPDGRRVVSAAENETIAVWDIQTGTLIHKLEGHQSWVNSVAVSPDGRRIISGSSDNSVAVWDLESGTLIRKLKGHRDTVRSVAVAPDGRRIVSGSDDNTVAVWDLQAGRRVATLTLDGWIRSVAWHPDGRSILAGDRGGNLYRLEYREG